MRPLKLKLLNLQEENFKKGLFGRITQPPLIHAFLAAMIPKDLNIDVEIIDEQIEPINFDMDCDIVAFTVTTHIAKKCYDYAQEFKKRNKTVIMGGYHVTLCPDEAQKHADSIIVGESEIAWPQLLKDLVRGTLKKRYDSPGHVDLSAIPIPRRDLLKSKKYIIPNTIIATRGCPYNCNYCASSKIFGKHRRRDPNKVIEEIKSLRFKNWKEKQAMFVDDELFFPKKEALEFFQKLEKLNIKWVSQATITDLFDRELMQAAAKSGCIGLIVGIESLNPETYKHIKKYQNLREGLDQAIKYANNLGIALGALLILGLDTESPESINETINILKKSRFIIIDFSILRAYPNTSTYSDLLCENRVRKDWWLDNSQYEDAFNNIVPDYFKVYFKPKYFTPSELQIKAIGCELKVNTLFSYNKLKNIFGLLCKGNKSLVLRLVLTMVIMNLNFRIMKRKIKKIKKG